MLTWLDHLIKMSADVFEKSEWAKTYRVDNDFDAACAYFYALRQQEDRLRPLMKLGGIVTGSSMFETFFECSALAVGFINPLHPALSDKFPDFVQKSLYLQIEPELEPHIHDLSEQDFLGTSVPSMIAGIMRNKSHIYIDFPGMGSVIDAQHERYAIRAIMLVKDKLEGETLVRVQVVFAELPRFSFDKQKFLRFFFGERNLDDSPGNFFTKEEKEDRSYIASTYLGIETLIVKSLIYYLSGEHTTKWQLVPYITVDEINKIRNRKKQRNRLRHVSVFKVKKMHYEPTIIQAVKRERAKIEDRKVHVRFWSRGHLGGRWCKDKNGNRVLKKRPIPGCWKGPEGAPKQQTVFLLESKWKRKRVKCWVDFSKSVSFNWRVK